MFSTIFTEPHLVHTSARPVIECHLLSFIVWSSVKVRFMCKDLMRRTGYAPAFVAALFDRDEMFLKWGFDTHPAEPSMAAS